MGSWAMVSSTLSKSEDSVRECMERSVPLEPRLRVPGVEEPDAERAELSAISFLSASSSRSNLSEIDELVERKEGRVKAYFLPKTSM